MVDAFSPSRRAVLAGAGGLAAAAASPFTAANANAPTSLLHVSFDPTREVFKDINTAFSAWYKEKTGVEITINQSHGGSGAQARAVIEGLKADLVSLALEHDVDAIAEKAHLLPANWRGRLPNHSTPFTSTIVFLVRKGNPKGIRDWADLIKPGVQIVISNPKTSGGARWGYLAAYGYAARLPGATPKSAEDYITKFYEHVPVLDVGARGATITFDQRHIGDVLVSWEAEARQSIAEFAPGSVEIVYPSVSIKAEPEVALIDKNAEANGTTQLAQAYLSYLYSPRAQQLFAKNFYRPAVHDAWLKYASAFPNLNLFTVDEQYGGWVKAHAAHFADGALFDRIYRKK